MVVWKKRCRCLGKRNVGIISVFCLSEQLLSYCADHSHFRELILVAASVCIYTCSMHVWGSSNMKYELVILIIFLIRFCCYNWIPETGYFMKNRGLFISQFWRMGSPRSWSQERVRAFVLCHPVVTGKADHACNRGNFWQPSLEILNPLLHCEHF